jgi:hypothetical protein
MEGVVNMSPPLRNVLFAGKFSSSAPVSQFRGVTRTLQVPSILFALPLPPAAGTCIAARTKKTVSTNPDIAFNDALFIVVSSLQI